MYFINGLYISDAGNATLKVLKFISLCISFVFWRILMWFLDSILYNIQKDMNIYARRCEYVFKETVSCIHDEK